MQQKTKISVWDADFIPYYVCHNKDKDYKKTLDDCINKCNELINNINKETQAEAYTGFLTFGKCFRYKVYPEYKGNRKYLNLPDYINEVKDYLINNHNFIYLNDYEADDLVVSYKVQNPNFDITIISPDKDILYLEGINYNPKKNEFIKVSKEESELYFWTSMIVGDTADNIKGIKGIGPVNAKKILSEVKLFSTLRERVLEEYCKIYGESKGIEQFYINYKCLKIVDDIPLKIDVELNKIITCE
jgi:5'-3' exonuclease